MPAALIFALKFDFEATINKFYKKILQVHNHGKYAICAQCNISFPKDSKHS